MKTNAGTEALFADVGHFTVKSIQISMCSVIYPALILAYTGQAAFLRKHNNLIGDPFFQSIPRKTINSVCLFYFILLLLLLLFFIFLKIGLFKKLAS